MTSTKVRVGGAASLAICLIVLCGVTAPATSDPLTYSSHETDTTPSGVQFHGPFLNETLEVTASALPAHDFLEISCDLFIIRTWDGSVETQPPPSAGISTSLGPDYFRLGVAGGPTLLYTTFSNRPDSDAFRQESKFQNYPSQVPGDHLAAQTGAAAKNSLGYWFPHPGPSSQHQPVDATYKLHFIIPHHDAKAMLQLSAMGLSVMEDESWGVTNVVVRAIPTDHLTFTEYAGIDRAFAIAIDLTAADQPAAFQKLILGMDDTADWIQKNVQPQVIDAAGAEQQIANMCGDDTKVNERYVATSRLLRMGPLVEPYLRDARRTAHGEQRARIDAVLTKLGVMENSDEGKRRILLATRVLEIIGTPHAMQVRKALTEFAG